MRTADLFAGTSHAKPPRKKPRILAHVADAGQGNAVMVIRFECDKCGWDSDWIEQTMTISEAKKGIPCERCNKPC